MEYVNNIIVIVVVVAIQIVMKIFLRKKARPTPKTKSNIIRQPKYYLYVGISGLIIFTFGAIYSFLDGAWPYSIIIGMMDFIYLWIIFLQKNWKIEIFEEYFIFRNTCGRRKIYKYDEVMIKKMSSSTRVYFNGRRIITISHFQDNWDALEKAILDFNKKQ